MNPYTVDHATHTTASSWDEIPFDNQLMIWRSVYEDMLADRRRARLLCFKFMGFIAQVDRLELLLGVDTWLHQWRLFEDLNNSLNYFDWPPEPEPLQAVERRLETRLRAVLDEVFRPLDKTEDELNLTGQAWTQIAFRIQDVRREVRSSDGYRHAEIRATSVDCLHRIRLRFLNLPRQRLAVNIRYAGPQRFRTYATYDYEGSQGGDLEEYRRMSRATLTAADEPEVFENWNTVDWSVEL
jgi:hypothetical protein